MSCCGIVINSKGEVVTRSNGLQKKCLQHCLLGRRGVIKLTAMCEPHKELVALLKLVSVLYPEMILQS